jgi:hypothetical protein
MKSVSNPVRLPSGDEEVAPVTILDAQGQVVRVVAATEFRSTHPRADTFRHPASGFRRQPRGEH